MPAGYSISLELYLKWDFDPKCNFKGTEYNVDKFHVFMKYISMLC